VKIEKKLIALSAIAIMAGVACIAPLMFLMSARADLPPDQQPQFSVSIPYAYIGNYLESQNVTAGVTFGFSDGNNLSMLPIFYTIAVNAVPNFEPQSVASDAIVEYYVIEVSSDKGFIGNTTYRVGVAYNTSKPYDTFHFYRDQWFDSNSSRDAFSMYGVWGNGTSIGFKTGTGVDWNRSFGELETIFITMKRQGWVILNSNSTIAHLADSEVVAQVQLEKYGDGFLYNTIVPEDELSRIDPLVPGATLLK